jgi:3-dehydroquinate synthase
VAGNADEADHDNSMNHPAGGHELRVNAPRHEAHGYDVVVRAGALDDIAIRVAAAAPAARYALIVPSDIAASHGARVLGLLRAGGLTAELLEFPAGEAHKTRETWAGLTDRMLELGFGRDAAVIALGGGVAGDLAGFVAATYMRGVPVVQVPTTLLAMIDASVGAKSGVDTHAGKNLVGAFHAPQLVIADPLVLRTLPPGELSSGLAEAVKHGAILDAAYFDWIGAHASDILSLDAAALEHLIARSVQLKAGVVSEDPYEHGLRAVLNFGHTVGHALELQQQYRMPHGHAVAQGMVVEAAVGEACGVTAPGTRAQLVELLDHCALPTVPTAGDWDVLAGIMRLDKKARLSRPRLPLLERIGACARNATGSWTFEVPEDVLAAAVRKAASAGPAV